MGNVLSIIWYKNSHLITAFNLDTKSILFEESICNLADTLVYNINRTIKKYNVDIHSFKYVAISYNLKSFTDMRLYYCIALPLAQVLKIKVLDITKDAEEELSYNTNNNEESDMQLLYYLNKVHKIIEDKIKVNDFVDIMDPKPIYIGTTKYKKINEQILY